MNKELAKKSRLVVYGPIDTKKPEEMKVLNTKTGEVTLANDLSDSDISELYLDYVRRSSTILMFQSYVKDYLNKRAQIPEGEKSVKIGKITVSKYYRDSFDKKSVSEEDQIELDKLKAQIASIQKKYLTQLLIEQVKLPQIY